MYITALIKTLDSGKITYKHVISEESYSPISQNIMTTHR